MFYKVTMIRNEANEKCQLIEYTMQNQIIYVKISPLPKIQDSLFLFTERLSFV